MNNYTDDEARTSGNGVEFNPYFMQLLQNTDSSEIVISKRASQVDLQNTQEVFFHVRSGVHSLQALTVASSDYHKIQLKMTAMIVAHLNDLDSSYINNRKLYPVSKAACQEQAANNPSIGNSCMGDLQFVKPSLFFTRNMDSDIDTVPTFPVTTGNRDLAYMFLMYRKILGYKIGDTNDVLADCIMSMKDGDGRRSQYNDHDLLATFRYKIEGSEIEPHMLQQGIKTMKKGAVDLFKANQAEVESIVKSVFRVLSTECYSLKSVSDENKQLICNSQTDTANPDHLIDYMVCVEIFDLVNKDMFCNAIPYADETL